MKKYELDSYNGLIYEVNKKPNIAKYNLDFIRNARANFAKSMYDYGIRRIDTFQINASAYACAASC